MKAVSLKMYHADHEYIIVHFIKVIVTLYHTTRGDFLMFNPLLLFSVCINGDSPPFTVSAELLTMNVGIIE